MLRIVVVDTNVLIRFGRIGRMDLLAAVPDTAFVTPNEVLEELVRPESRDPVQAALAQGWLRRVEVEGEEELKRLDELTKPGKVGRGEAACLSLAESRGWALATDDRRGPFRRLLALLEEERRVMDTTAIVVALIHAGVITIVEADGFLQQWRKDLHVPFSSFGEVLGSRG